MKIETAADWTPVKDEFRSIMKGIGYNPDVHRIIRNIDSMVTELARLEVEARRTRKLHTLQEKVVKINDAIKMLEQWLMIAALMR